MIARFGVIIRVGLTHTFKFNGLTGFLFIAVRHVNSVINLSKLKVRGVVRNRGSKRVVK